MIKRTSERKKIIVKLDNLFSQQVRKRDHYTCVKCGKIHEEKSKNLTNSHYFSRKFYGTRWDFKNCDAVCWIPCHKYQWESDKQGSYRAFKVKQIGEKALELLEYKAYAITKYSSSELNLMYELLKKETK